MTALAASSAPLARRLLRPLGESVTLARRNLAHVRQIPEKLFDVTLQPVMFVLLFAFVFGDVIAIPGGDYRAYLLGGILVQTITFGVMGPGVAMATDLGEGIVDRFRSLPIARSSFLAGHVLAELAAAGLGIAVTLATGLAIGWSVDSSAWEALAAVALVVAWATAMIWLGTLLGVVARSPDAVSGSVFLVIFPLTFVSSVFVPIGGLPAGLRQVAEWNPVSAVATAVRELFGNPTGVPADAAWPLTHPVAAAVLWTGAILAVVVPLALWRFRARTSS